MKALILDIDGVMLRDDRALPGAPELVDWLLRSSHPFLFLTNYSSQTPADLANRMQAAGLKIPLEHFYTSAMATAEFLDHQAGDRRRAYVVGEGALVHALYQAGFTLTETDADFVVLGETRAYNFDMIQRAAQLVLQGARFVATNPDVAGPGGRPSCGAFAAPIERITGKRPFYVGKPSAFMMRAALRHLQAHSEEAWMVGDNMETDIIAGLQTGLVTVLVLSGVSRREDLTRYAYRPDHIVPDAFALTALLESQGT
ncbi:MAG TPA: HAD-IIA family hydrolase [Vicinamibacteria bacterium]|nr:HAD-IIA family hydrolase [Vicinamibacteria bacterium]